MKYLFITLSLFALPAQADWGESFSSVGSYVQEKSDQAGQYVRDKRTENSSSQGSGQQGTPTGSGQIGTSVDPSAIVPSGVFPDGDKGSGPRRPGQ